MKRIAVLGSTGMLGHKVFQHLQATGKYHVAGMCRENFDATSNDSRRYMFQFFRPDVVINCVGLIKQRPEAKNAALMIELNALLPHKISDECGRSGARFIHFSSDCVFNGDRGLYTEDDHANATDLYGQTKYIGEVPDAPHALTLRTSIIGREIRGRYGLLEWLLSQNGKTVRGYSNVYWSGVTTNWLAGTLEKLIDEFPTLAGLYQVTTEREVTKYRLLQMLRAAYGLDIQITPDDSLFCDRSMIGRRFETVTGIKRPNWPDLMYGLVKEGL